MCTAEVIVVRLREVVVAAEPDARRVVVAVVRTEPPLFLAVVVTDCPAFFVSAGVSSPPLISLS